MKTPRKEIVVYDEFAYNGIKYELAIHETERIEEGGTMVEPQSYHGILRVAQDSRHDIPKGIQTVIEEEQAVEYYDVASGEIKERDVSPKKIADQLMEDLHDVWESYSVKNLDELGVEVPAEPDV